MGSTQDIMTHLESNLIDHKGKTKAKKHESNKPVSILLFIRAYTL